MHKLLLTGVAACIASSANAAEFAINCVGTSGDQTETLIYVVDDVKQTVSQFVPATSQFLPKCANANTCEKNFSPTIISLTERLGPRGQWDFQINRQLGTVNWTLSMGGISSSFSGKCSRIPVPKVDTTKNAF